MLDQFIREFAAPAFALVAIWVLWQIVARLWQEELKIRRFAAAEQIKRDQAPPPPDDRKVAAS